MKNQRKMFKIGERKKLKRIKNSKMTKWLPALKEVLDSDNILLLCDKDLVFLVNQKLQPDERITEECFSMWKGNKRNAPSEEIGKQFIELIQYALIKQKMSIERKMFDETNSTNWQRWAWLLERKFEEWNLKHISENINKNEQSTVINITAGNAEQKALIENIINATFEEIPFKELAPKKEQNNNEKEDYDVQF